MEQGNQSASTASSPDFPQKKPVRQLDFSAAMCRGATPPAAATVGLEQPPQQLQNLPPVPVPVPPRLPVSLPSIPLPTYCECFASGVYCDGCNCTNCCNNVENEAARHDAVEATLERNPNAFRPKIGSNPHATRDSRANAAVKGAVGPSGFISPSSKRRRHQSLVVGNSLKDRSIHRLAQLPQVSF
ncbi:hypothetical protein BHE74_00039256 [Ensete ventricosum]|nr:hypothetical protein GW17_00022259 [Ensete ventricosum]RWW54169.1 hypothetical protein BHE74_00039256 [Ensete ventricosum]RZS15309.1 hypothetical protein BHM03_00047124 [Ensete ventricosum]